jgi:hypothetical protein
MARREDSTRNYNVYSINSINNILLWEFDTKMDKEDIFKPAVGNESLREICNDNGVVNFATSKNLTIKSAVFPRLNIDKFDCT